MTLDREAIHSQVDRMNHTNWHVKAIVHALIDLGRIEVFECQYEDCILDTREFLPRRGGRGHEAYSLTVDHIDARSDGGSNRPENLRAIHASCNVARGKRIDTEVTREKKRRARAAFLADPERSAKWRESMKSRKPRSPNVTSNHNGRRPALTPEQIAEAVDLRTQGWRRADVAARFGISPSTLANALAGRGAYRKE